MTKILVVEDDAGLRQALEINLRLENYEPVVAADGEEAIASMPKRPTSSCSI